MAERRYQSPYLIISEHQKSLFSGTFQRRDRDSNPSHSVLSAPVTSVQVTGKSIKLVREGFADGTFQHERSNPPLGFTLQHLDPSHPYLASRGFTAETIEHFGLGYCARGMLKGRIAIPLHDAAGVLIGYAGRLVDYTAITDECPKYLFPGRRKHGGTTIDFRKSRFLYNGYRIAQPVDRLVVCEGYPATWWLHQAGYTNVVGLMGSDCSGEQADLIVRATKPDGHVWLFTDADSAGNTCAANGLTLIGASRFVRRVSIEHGQPTDYTPSDLAGRLWNCS